jgi:hypothetical protein
MGTRDLGQDPGCLYPHLGICSLRPPATPHTEGPCPGCGQEVADGGGIEGPHSFPLFAVEETEAWGQEGLSQRSVPRKAQRLLDSQAPAPGSEL